MGYLAAADMAAHAPLDAALSWHLQSNHYPPVPLSMLPACKQAIEHVRDEEPDALVPLPDGISYRGQRSAPAWAIFEQHHLDAFLQSEED